MQLENTLNIYNSYIPASQNDEFNALENEFSIFKNTNEIDLTTNPTYIPFGIMGICLEGYLVMEIFQSDYLITKGNLIVVLPGQVLSLKEKSPDLKVSYFHISQSLINDVLSGVSRLSPLFFIHMRKRYLYNLTDDEFLRYFSYYNLIDSKLKEYNKQYHREYVVDTLKLFYLDLYGNYESTILSISPNATDNRKEKLTYDFFLLIMDNYKKEREVAFYANKLSITPKYLSAVVKETSGRSAKDWVTEYILFEIKSLLKNRSLNIQEITVKTNFSNQASLGRFFKKHTGMAPSEYRINKK